LSGYNYGRPIASTNSIYYFSTFELTKYSLDDQSIHIATGGKIEHAIELQSNWITLFGISLAKSIVTFSK